MAIRYVDQAPGARRKPNPEARETGEARFATPVESDAPVNPDAAAELPFTDLPAAEKKKRTRRS